MLEAQHLTVAYGRHRALEDVSVRVDKGEICVILGANGAGKSTLLNTIAGTVHAAPGASVVVDGRPVTGLKPSRIVEAGIALVPQGRGIFGELTVRENLELGAYARRARATEQAARDRVHALFPLLVERRGQIVRTMSGGEQQMVAIGRALMSNPDILMLDEPSLGLSPILSASLFRTLAEIRRSGVGILLVEQNARQSLRIADRGYLLENGHILAEASAASLAGDPAVVHAYLGGAAPGPAGRLVFDIPAAAPVAATAAGDLARLAAALAVRAGDIHAAYQHAIRKAGPLPSAFVGRYDKDADPGPTMTRRPVPRSSASPDGATIAAGAADLARRASDRLAAHMITQRLSGRIPSAFAATLRGAPAQTAHDMVGAMEPALSASSAAGPAEPGGLGRLAESLAARAVEIEAAHRAALRAARPPATERSRRLLNGEGPGKSAAGNGATVPPRPLHGRTLSVNRADLSVVARDLAERAAHRQAEHLAKLRSGRTRVGRHPKPKGA